MTNKNNKKGEGFITQNKMIIFGILGIIIIIGGLIYLNEKTGIITSFTERNEIENVLKFSTINSNPNYTPNSTANISIKNQSAFISLNETYGLIFYDGFDLMDDNIQNNTYDYTSNNITGYYEDVEDLDCGGFPCNSTTFYNKTGGLFGGAGEVRGLLTYDGFGGYLDTCTDTGYGTICTTYPTITFGNTINQIKFNVTAPHSIVFWFYPINMSKDGQTRLVSNLVESEADGIHEGWTVSWTNHSVTNKNTIEYCFVSSTGSVEYTCIQGDSNTINFNQWNHITVTYNGTNTGNARKLWINGVQYLTNRCGATAPVCSAVKNPNYFLAQFHLGTNSYQLGGIQPSHFRIDELMIFNNTLSETFLININNNISNRFNPRSEINFLQNFSKYLQANISIANCEYNFSSNISVKIAQGTTNVTNNCSMNNYNLWKLGDLNNVNLSFILNIGNSNTNTFITPIIKGNITIDLFEYDYPPNITFNYQQPIDLSSSNIEGFLNISYNITDERELNTSTIILYHKNNDTTNDISDYINGTAIIGYQGFAYNSNSSNTFLWNLHESHISPSTYNLDPSIMDNTIHGVETLNLNEWIKAEIQNVSNDTAYNIWEVMVNASVTANTLQFWYCNSSYSSGFVTLPTQNNCINFYSMSPTPLFNNTHNQSSHKEIPMVINTTTGTVGTVKVTPTSYLLIRGSPTGGQRFVYYVNQSVRAGASATSNTGGTTWTNRTYTFDIHLDQFHINESLWYYVCANDTSTPVGSACSSVRQDLYQIGGLPPNVFVTSPIEQTYSGNISINYSASSPNGYNIINYSVALLNTSESFLLNINSNTTSTSLIWDSSNVTDGEYIIRVLAMDNLSQWSYGFSSNFTVVNVQAFVLPDDIMLNLNITGTNGGRFATWYGFTHPNSTTKFDARDLKSLTSSSNYTQFKSTEGSDTFMIDSFNNSALPREINLTYFSNPAMSGLLNYTWNWNQLNFTCNLTDYGTDNTRITPVNSVLLNNTVEYSTSFTGANNYLKLRIEAKT